MSKYITPSLAADVINCPVQDECGINDFQKIPHSSPLSINQVGINRYRLPVFFSDNPIVGTKAEVETWIKLPAKITGANMSRFCSIIQEETASPLTFVLLKKIASRIQEELRDSDSSPDIEESFIKLQMDYPLKQPSLKSSLWGWQYYPFTMAVHLKKGYTPSFIFTIDYEYSSTCPCSLSLAKQYELEFEQKKRLDGVGLATPHGQRSCLKLELLLDAPPTFFVAELVDFLRKVIPTETQSMAKRVDEQAFAILNGQYPIFVEHVARNLANAFKTDFWPKELVSYKAKIEHFESLHSHNAYAFIEGDRSNI